MSRKLKGNCDCGKPLYAKTFCRPCYMKTYRDTFQQKTSKDTIWAGIVQELGIKGNNYRKVKF